MGPTHAWRHISHALCIHIARAQHMCTYACHISHTCCTHFAHDTYNMELLWGSQHIYTQMCDTTTSLACRWSTLYTRICHNTELLWHSHGYDMQFCMRMPNVYMQMFRVFVPLCFVSWVQPWPLYGHFVVYARCHANSCAKSHTLCVHTLHICIHTLWHHFESLWHFVTFCVVQHVWHDNKFGMQMEHLHNMELGTWRTWS